MTCLIFKIHTSKLDCAVPLTMRTERDVFWFCPIQGQKHTVKKHACSLDRLYSPKDFPFISVINIYLDTGIIADTHLKQK